MDWWWHAQVDVARSTTDGAAFFQGMIPAMRTTQSEPGQAPQVMWIFRVPGDYVIDLVGAESYQACLSRLKTPGAACTAMLESNRTWLLVWGPGAAELHIIPGRQPIEGGRASDWLICQSGKDTSTCQDVAIPRRDAVP